MELTCPSCQSKHDTNQHIDAFEIHCSCGYSILIPDTSSSQPVEDLFVSAAMDSEDNALKISPSIDSPSASQATATDIPDSGLDFSAETMTPSENLPEGMVYDPSEIPQRILKSSAQSLDLGQESIENLQIDSPAAIGISSKPQTIGQKIIEKSLLANAGQFLGSSYQITIQGLSEEGLLSVGKNLESLINSRPWLIDELKKRNLNLTKLKNNQNLVDVPEMVAVELYLLTIQNGGTCTFKLQNH